ncbi:MAG: hypothetical protein ACRDTV_20055, partial [Mycobacterium sp.]
MPVQPCPSPAADGGVVDSGRPNSATRRRPYLAASVTLVGATLIAASPVTPNVAAIQERAVRLASSDLISLADPTGGWSDVFTEAFANIQQIGSEITADPTPVLSQIIDNQTAFTDTLDTNLQTIGSTLSTFGSQGLPQALQDFVTSIEAGDFSDAVNNFNTDLLLGLIGVAQPIQT